MPLIPSKLSFLPEFEGRQSLYSDITQHSVNEAKIRILTIWPNRDRFAPIEASLSIENIFKRPRYNAISYYWGNAKYLETVVVHGSDQGSPHHSCEVPVTQNLTAALRQFRARACADNKPLRLWTDALCINQCDAIERTLQIGIIRHIFSLASSVWIWLGESNDLVEKGLNTLVSAANCYPAYSSKSAPKRKLQEPILRLLSPSLALEDEIDLIKQFVAIDALPYWRRGWTFQEAMQSKKYICYGELRIVLRKWSHMSQTCSKWDKKIRVRLQDTSFWSSLNSSKSSVEIDYLMRPTSLNSTLRPFQVAERQFHDRLAKRQLGNAGSKFCVSLQRMFYRTSDPRDSVFVLRNLVPELVDMKSDYTDSIEIIFGEATELILRHARVGIGELGYWTHPHASSHLPSWAFDFTHCSESLDENGDARFLFATRDPDASAGSLIRVERRDMRSLYAAGFIFDEVQEVDNSVDRRLWNRHSWKHQLLLWLQHVLRHVENLAASKKDRDRQIYSFLRTVGSNRRDPNNSSLCDLHLPGSLNPQKGVTNVSEAVKSLVKILQDSDDSDGSVATYAASSFEVNTDFNAQRTRLVITKDHRFGLAHKTVAVGDRVAILASGNVPFMLRPVPVGYVGEEAYRIIGGCYIDGKSCTASGFAATSMIG